MQKCYKSRFIRFVSAVFSDIKHDTQWFSWFGMKKDFESRNSSQQFSDLETNLILKIVMDWLIRKNAERKFASQFTPQLTRKAVQGSLWGEGALIKNITWNCALIYLYNCKITFFVPQNVRPAGRAGTLLEWLVAEGNTTPILSRALYQSIELTVVKTCLQHEQLSYA